MPVAQPGVDEACVEDDPELYAIGTVPTDMSRRTGNGPGGEVVLTHPPRPRAAPSLAHYADLAVACERRDIDRNRGVQVTQVDLDSLGGIAPRADDNAQAIQALQLVPNLNLASIERALLLVALDRARSPRHAAELLGISRDVLANRMRRHGIVWGPEPT